jgi:hypothetical protein
MVKSTIISVMVLLFIGAAAGLGYVWYVGNTKPVDVASIPAPTPKKTVMTQTPEKKAPEGPVSVAEQAFNSPITAGSNSSITIRTRPEAACSISVSYGEDIKSKDGGLIPKTADEFGNAQWTWTVEPGRPAGKWPVEITCALGKESGYYKTYLEIIN